MKRIIVTALAVVLFTGASQAQKADRTHSKHGGHIARELNLTDEQKAKVKTLREAQKKEMQQLKANDKITVAEWKAQRKALHEKHKSQFESVLTPAQKEEWNSRKTGKNDRGERKGAGNRGKGFEAGREFGQQAAFWKKELNLSADQETKLKGFLQAFKTKASDVRANNNLTQEQKKAQLKDLAQQYMNQGKAVLNAEQLKKLDDLLAKRKGRQHRNL